MLCEGCMRDEGVLEKGKREVRMKGDRGMIK